MCMNGVSGKWKLKGYDTFKDAFYPIAGSYESEKEAEKAARVQLAAIEATQPSESSGGQEEDGIQDRVYLVAPDMTHRRVFL